MEYKDKDLNQPKENIWSKQKFDKFSEIQDLDPE